MPALLQFSIMFFAASEETTGRDKYRLILDAARFADRHAFSSVWIPERHFASLGGLYPNPSVLHAALAATTERIQLRAGSVVLPLHHPLRVAEEWSVVDNLSNGRVGISFASGWNPDDFAFFPDRYQDRWDELFRTIPIVQQLWRGEPLGVTNGLGRDVDVRIHPRPVQAELPTWVTAARSPQTFSHAGAVGANVLTHLLDQDIEDVAANVAQYRRARAEAGIDPDSGVVTIMLHTFVGDSQEFVRAQSRKPYCEFLKSNARLLQALADSRNERVDLDSFTPEERDDFVNFLYDRFASTRSFIGTPESCLPLAARLRAIGVDEVACLLDFGPAYEAVMENLAHLDRLRELCASGSFDDLVARTRDETRAPSAPVLRDGEAAAVADGDDLQRIRSRAVEELNRERFYERLGELGFGVDSGLRLVSRIWRRDGEALGELDPSVIGDGGVAALVDACVHVAIAAQPWSRWPADGEPLIPWEVPNVELPALDGDGLSVHVRFPTQPDGRSDEAEAELRIIAGRHRPPARALTLRLRRPALAEPSAVLDQLSYELRWEPAAPDPKSSNPAHASWIILADAGGVGRALAARLEALGQPTTVIERETLPVLPQDDPAAFVAAAADAVDRALDDASAARPAIVFAWSVDGTPTAATSEGSLRSDQVFGSASALTLMQRVAERPDNGQPKIWLVTKGAQSVDGDAGPQRISQAPIWGLGRTSAIEHPESWGGMVDLDPDATADEDAAALLRAFAHDGEDQFAVRNGRTFVPRLIPGPPFEPAPLAIRHDAVYIVTGGVRGIGYEVAAWLVRKGARHLTLVGRTQLPPREKWDQLEADSAASGDVERIRALERAGARVVYAAVDVASESELRALADGLRRDGVPVRGIVHAASVWRDRSGHTLIRPVTHLDVASLDQVYRPKLLGSWLLHTVFGSEPLDFFVLFSSAASLTGSAGQGNYAAASVFLDALAHHRRRSGQHALSVNWGPVSGAGFGATAEGLRVHEYWETNGLKRITVEELLVALESLLPQSAPQRGVINVDWNTLADAFPSLRHAPWARAVLRPGSDEGRSAFVETLAGLPESERLTAVVEHVREQVREVMALDRLPEPGRKLFEMGMDSLMALALKSRLEKTLGTGIRVTAVFNYPTIESLSRYLLGALALGVTDAAPAAAPAPSDATLSRIQELSDEEVDRMLELRTRGAARP